MRACIYCHETIDHPRADPAPHQCRNPHCGRWTCYIDWLPGADPAGLPVSDYVAPPARREDPA